MAMGTERSKALHNFTLPCNLSWKNQRLLRCMKVNAGNGSDQHRLTTGEHNGEKRKHPSSENLAAADIPGGRIFRAGEDGIAAVREKVMLDLQTAADKIKESIFKDGLDDGMVAVSPAPPPPPPPPAVVAAPVEAEMSRPWNFRTRRGAFNAAVNGFASAGSGGVATVGGGAGGGVMVDVAKPSSGFSPLKAVAAGELVADRRKNGGTAAGGSSERPKFSVSLSKREIEEDFMAMVHHRPPRRPKKRAKVVQKQLDTLFPGLWLTEITPDMYKVNEAAP